MNKSVSEWTDNWGGILIKLACKGENECLREGLGWKGREMCKMT